MKLGALDIAVRLIDTHYNILKDWIWKDDVFNKPGVEQTDSQVVRLLKRTLWETYMDVKCYCITGR